jgi:ATP-dependent DNA helicase RecG
LTTPLAEQPLSSLRGVGPRLTERLGALGIERVQDLLFHLPLRYQDRTRIRPIGSLQPGEDVLIEGRVRGVDVVPGRRRSLLCRVQDGTGLISLRFFHFSAAQQRQLAAAHTLRAYGEVRPGRSGFELYHPETRIVDPDAPPPLDDRLTPIYPSTQGLQQTSLRKLVAQALERLADAPLDELLPAECLPADLRLSLQDALRRIHQPGPGDDAARLVAGEHPWQRRLAFEELLAHQLSLLILRRRRRSHGAPALASSRRLAPRLVDTLPFALTGAQQRVLAEIGHDLARPEPMMRLVQGDVGSGKTVVAALAALQAIEQGYQVAVMAPTEILAEQHLTSFRQWLEPLQLGVTLLTSRLPAAERRERLADLAEGRLALAVGTHALFQSQVRFHRLGLVIIDEQHRFGVHQRLSLRDKGEARGLLPHQLVMTATPIPRTLAMTAYADLDNSVLDELPPGRLPVDTVVVGDTRRDEVIERVRASCREGRQAYWVCTLIEESESLQCQAAETTAGELRERLPELRVGLVHGRLGAAEKRQVMDGFGAGEIDLLVATTVIEVGVDVPNASLMIIENAERLGLAQLHQLRGRVGRGSAASHCVLMYRSPLSRLGQQRLQALRELRDGFALAERDLELRGPGELLGTRQTGAMSFRIASLERDRDLLDAVRAAARRLQDTAAAEPLLRRWLGDRERFANA